MPTNVPTTDAVRYCTNAASTRGSAAAPDGPNIAADTTTAADAMASILHREK